MSIDAAIRFPDRTDFKDHLVFESPLHMPHADARRIAKAIEDYCRVRNWKAPSVLVGYHVAPDGWLIGGSARDILRSHGMDVTSWNYVELAGQKWQSLAPDICVYIGPLYPQHDEERLLKFLHRCDRSELAKNTFDPLGSTMEVEIERRAHFGHTPAGTNGNERENPTENEPKIT